MAIEPSKYRVEVCYTPGQYALYQEGFDIVVVIDVLRATSAMTAAIHNGVKSIIPVSSVEEAKAYQEKGYIVAAERDGKVVEGFPFGNSPYAFMNPELKDQTVVVTTTNGTRAIEMAKDKMVVIGCLNNLDILCKWLSEQHSNILLLASGWKDKFNLEDTICGGAIADTLLESDQFYADEDSTIAAKFIYRSAREHLWSFLRASSHRRRLMKLKIQRDVKFCLTPNTLHCIPIYRNGEIVKLEYQAEELASANHVLAE
jgi:2-phosphosulfolactate phosphatase